MLTFAHRSKISPFAALSFDIFVGAEANFGIDPVTVDIFGVYKATLYGGTTFPPFTVIPKFPLAPATCIEQSLRRRDVRRSSSESTESSPSRGRYGCGQCPAHATCVGISVGRFECVCDLGFTVVQSGWDTDYCAPTVIVGDESCTTMCENGMVCKNAVCVCPPHFRWNSTVGLCQEALDSPTESPCPPLSLSINGSCYCYPDTELAIVTADETLSCRLRDVCSTIVCGGNSSCVDDGCRCNPGFLFGPNGHDCYAATLTSPPANFGNMSWIGVHSNACLIGGGGCHPENAHCVYANNRSHCVCDAGYVGDGVRSCIRLMQCSAEDNGGCSVHATCSPSSTGPVCTCRPGYTGDGLQCQDTSCQVDNGGCPSNAVCRPSTVPGQPRCECASGYKGNGTSCFVSNGCMGDSDACDSTVQRCVPADNRGGTTCLCKPGFYQIEGSACSYIDHNCSSADAINNCPPHSICNTNGQGSGRCACTDGFTATALTTANEIRWAWMPGQECAPTDPCASNPCHGKNEMCQAVSSTTPTAGINYAETPLYRCACAAGYVRPMAGSDECVQVSPCSHQTRPGCSAVATCSVSAANVATCTCGAGYTGDGRTCTPINVCAGNAPVLNCGSNTHCVPLAPGSGKCVCNDGYRNVSLGCERIPQCTTMNGGCPAFSTCNEVENGSVTCSCVAGFVSEYDVSGLAFCLHQATTGLAAAAAPAAHASFQATESYTWVVAVVCAVALAPLTIIAAYDLYHRRHMIGTPYRALGNVESDGLHTQLLDTCTEIESS
jgi:hypothetical protein